MELSKKYKIEEEPMEYEPIEPFDCAFNCCQNFFENFSNLFSHMIEFHIEVLMKSIGPYKKVILSCIEQYEALEVMEAEQSLEDEEQLQEEHLDECWMEEFLNDEPTEIKQEDEIIYETPPLKSDSSIVQRALATGKLLRISQAFPKRPKRTRKKIDGPYFKCLTCNRCFPGVLELQRHEKRHQAPFICDFCDEKFFSRNSMKTHLFKHRAQEVTKPELVCSYCEMIFADEEQVEAHRLEFHTRGDEIHSCSFCSREFSVKYDLLFHLKRSHGEDDRIKCKLCYKKYQDEVSLKEHMLTHDIEEALVCLHCGKSFKGKKLLRQHVSYYHKASGYPNKNRQLACSVCDKVFAYANQVKSHEINIHGVGEAAFFCTFCNKGFAKQWDLANHELMHSDNRPFKCEQCPKAFRRTTHLKSHVFNVHTPMAEKPDFICYNCQKLFKNKESLRKHLTTTHNITMNEMYKQAGLPYNGRDIVSTKKAKLNEIKEQLIEIEIIGEEIDATTCE